VTDYSRTLGEVVQVMHAWGNLHHETIIGKKRPNAAVVEQAS
jgi:DNA-binding HxlR family transcriptional regulator